MTPNNIISLIKSYNIDVEDHVDCFTSLFSNPGTPEDYEDDVNCQQIGAEFLLGIKKQIEEHIAAYPDIEFPEYYKFVKSPFEVEEQVYNNPLSKVHHE